MSGDAFDLAVEQAQEFARSGRFGTSNGLEDDEELERADLIDYSVGFQVGDGSVQL